jgi:hypothetical protein
VHDGRSSTGDRADPSEGRTVTLDSSNVRVAVTGALSVGPEGTALPTTAESVLNAALKDLGYVGEDGVTETRDRSSDSIKAWQKAAIVRENVTEANLTYKFVLLETKKETIELYYAGTVDASDGSIDIDPSATGGRHVFVLDVIDGDDFIRTAIPSGEVTEVGDQVYANGSPIGYEITVRAYPSTALAGASARKWYSALVV